jgi:HK97 gp10 family phage protein
MAIEHVEGLRDLEKALAELPKATGRNVLRRVLLKRAQPIADAANALAPRDTGRLARAGAVSTRLSRRQAGLQRKEIGGGPRMTDGGFRSDPKQDVTVYAGYPSSPKSIVQEFGSIDQSPQPFMRPAWDGEKRAALDGIGKDLWAEIDKAAKRLARKAARLAAKG